MNISKKMQTAINEQINAEIYSAYMYLGMSTHFQTNGLPGFANWMYVQWQEELTHAMKFLKYVEERGGKVELKQIDCPPQDWKSSLQIMQASLKHEQHVTSLINKLVELSLEEKDYATHNMLQWYISEQVEEEANVSAIIDELEMVGDNKQGFLMIDRELRGRAFVDETKKASE